ncbi:MAG: peptidoglycan DD-metalloendopeptidase family protein [Hyphomonadaceae bacterium]|nr:peptidoglycan DD-metalloendopeptidase family protein [Hyphomonadaceae bacterium]
MASTLSGRVIGKWRLGAAVAATLALPVLALAQGASGPEEARKRLETDKGRLDVTQKRSKELQADLDKLSAERQRINARLIETGKLIHQSEAQLSLIESKVDQLQAQEKTLRTTLEERHGTISGLLAAMQRMGRNPPPVMITRREDALSMVRSAMLLAAVFPELRGQAISLAEQLKDLARVMTSIRTEGEKLKAETGRLNEARTRLAALQEVKRQSQSERQAELDSVLKSAAQIARNVEDLSDLIGKLDKEVAARTELGSYEKDIAAADQAPASDGRTAAAVLAPSAGSVAMLSPGRIRPDIPFVQAKGQLPLPAQGRRVFAFGDKTQYGTQSKGLVIQTRHGGQVVSPADGWIVYAGEFRTYGKLLIVNAGGGYHILLAGLSQIDVQFGQFVLTGEAVGVMGSAVKSPQVAKAQDNGPVLYIEFRKDGRSIDPDPWWSDASRKVQG